MKEKSTKKFESINTNATVGNKRKIMLINPPLPKKDKDGNYVLKANTAKSARPVRKPCSGCSRKRKSV